MQVSMECSGRLRCQGNDDYCSGQVGLLVYNRSIEEIYFDAQESMLSFDNRHAIYLIADGISCQDQMCVI